MKKIKKLSGLIFLLLACAGCYEDTEGCRDVLARNYDVAADQPCDDCCTYPELRFSIAHRYGGEPLDLDSVFTNTLGQSFSFQRWVMVLSDVKVQIMGQEFQTISTFQITTADEDLTIADDVTLLQNRVFNMEAGEWLLEGQVSRLSFKAGFTTLVPENAIVTPDNHPINQLPTSMSMSPNLAVYEVEMDSLSVGQDSILTIGFGQSITYDFEVDTLAVRGFDLGFVLEADYKALFDTLDFTGAPIDINTKMLGELPRIIRIRD